MSKDFVFFSDDINKWNYNKLINNRIDDPFNPKRKQNENENYNIHKWNCLIFLKEILINSNFNTCFNSCLNEWIHKKTGYGGKSDYYEILNITVYIFYYNLFKSNNDIINYKDFRKWCLKNPLYIKSDKTKDDFEEMNDWHKVHALNEYNMLYSFNRIFKKVMEIEDDEIKKRYLIISMFLKKKILDGSGLGKLC